MPRQVGYRFPILDSANNVTTTSVDMGDMFVEKDAFLNSGLYAWGRNDLGQMGDNTAVQKSSPVQIGSLTNWKQAGGSQYFTIALKTDGTLWSWGDASIIGVYGQLGLGNSTTYSSPVQVGTLTNWKQISVGSVQNTLAIKTDGTLWAWGRNSYGNLGLNDQVHRSSPSQVGSLTNWKQVACGYFYTAAIKTDGTLWTWGYNSSGQLGLGNITTYSSPVQVGSLTNWKQVSGVYNNIAAIKTDGTLWAWGNNTDGRLGLNDRTSRSSPVQVGSLTDWKQVSISTYSGLTASVKTDGTLWTWGNNTDGRLGLNDTIHRSSPTQVGSLTNWKLVYASGYHISAIKTDGTLWTWGTNTRGQLGFSDIVHRSSPVQVGSLSNWKSIFSSDAHTLAIVSDDFYTYT